MLGDEIIVGDNESSLRGFASREHTNVDFRPRLSFEYLPEPIAGDFSRNGLLDEADLTLLTTATMDGTDLSFDLNNDQLLNELDRQVWVEDLKNTWFGDANLDGEFNTADLTAVLEIGEYEDMISENSTWSAGDWSGDFEFDTARLGTRSAERRLRNGAACRRDLCAGTGDLASVFDRPGGTRWSSFTTADEAFVTMRVAAEQRGFSIKTLDRPARPEIVTGGCVRYNRSCVAIEGTTQRQFPQFREGEAPAEPLTFARFSAQQELRPPVT